MSAGRRVVITGLGVVSPLGNSAEALATALAAGTSGVAPLTTIPPLEGLVTYGGEAREFTGDIDNFGELDKDMKKSIRKALKMMCRESMMAVAAAQQALARSALVERVPERVGVVFGSDYMLSPPDDLLAGMIKCGVAAGGLVYEQWGTEGLVAPERIVATMVALEADWTTWNASEPVDVLRPEAAYEGIEFPLTPSAYGAATHVRQLRDPGIFEEHGRTYLFYSIAGEMGIALAELNIALAPLT